MNTDGLKQHCCIQCIGCTLTALKYMPIFTMLITIYLYCAISQVGSLGDFMPLKWHRIGVASLVAGIFTLAGGFCALSTIGAYTVTRTRTRGPTNYFQNIPARRRNNKLLCGRSTFNSGGGILRSLESCISELEYCSYVHFV